MVWGRRRGSYDEREPVHAGITRSFPTSSLRLMNEQTAPRIHSPLTSSTPEPTLGTSAPPARPSVSREHILPSPTDAASATATRSEEERGATKTETGQDVALQHAVGVVGSGAAGGAAVRAILRAGQIGDLIYVSPREGESCRSVAEAMRAHSPYGQTCLRVGSWVDLEQAKAIVIALDDDIELGERVSLLRQVVHALDNEAPEAVLIVATEPVDVLTTVAARTSNRPTERVFGTGTCAESLEVQERIARHYGVSKASVYAMVVGHHGGAAVPLWNRVLIGGHQIVRGSVLGKSFDRESMWTAFERGCASAEKTSGDCEARTFETCLLQCLQAVTDDERRVLPVSTLMTGEFGLRDVALALPCVVGARGVHGNILPDLSQTEEEAFRNAAKEVETALTRISAAPEEA